MVKHIKEVHLQGDILEDEFLELLDVVVSMRIFRTMPPAMQTRVMGLIVAKVLVNQYDEEQLDEVVDRFSARLKSVMHDAVKMKREEEANENPGKE